MSTCVIDTDSQGEGNVGVYIVESLAGRRVSYRSFVRW